MNSDAVNGEGDCALVVNAAARVSLYADSASVEQYAALFTQDAVWEMQGAPAIEGLDAIVAAVRERRAAGTTGPQSNARHVVLSTVVDISGDDASAVSIFQFYTDFDTSPSLRAMGVYKDVFRREAKSWLLSRRLIEWSAV